MSHRDGLAYCSKEPSVVVVGSRPGETDGRERFVDEASVSIANPDRRERHGVRVGTAQEKSSRGIEAMFDARERCQSTPAKRFHGQHQKASRG
jgi:hypothetical protein